MQKHALPYIGQKSILQKKKKKKKKITKKKKKKNLRFSDFFPPFYLS